MERPDAIPLPFSDMVGSLHLELPTFGLITNVQKSDRQRHWAIAFR